FAGSSGAVLGISPKCFAWRFNSRSTKLRDSEKRTHTPPATLTASIALPTAPTRRSSKASSKEILNIRYNVSNSLEQLSLRRDLGSGSQAHQSSQILIPLRERGWTLIEFP